MAKGLYLMSDGQVLVEYGKRRRVPIPFAQRRSRSTRVAHLSGGRQLAANGCHGRPARSRSDSWSFGRPELRGIFRSPTIS